MATLASVFGKFAARVGDTERPIPHGKQAGTRQMIELLGLGKKHGYAPLQEAVATALTNGCGDVAAVRYLLTAEASVPPPLESCELGGLARYERPLPGIQDYD